MSRDIKRQYNLAQWAPVIKRCKASGMTVKAWCKENDVDLKQFYYWQRLVRESLCAKLSDENMNLPTSVSSPAPTFVSLKGQYNDTVDISPSFKPDMILQSGDIRIELTNNTSMKLLADVMKVIHHV